MIGKSTKTAVFGQKPQISSEICKNHSFWPKIHKNHDFQPKTVDFTVFEFKTITLLISFQSKEKETKGKHQFR